jgi:hypothetical protein
VPEAAPEWMPVCGRQSVGHGRRAGLEYRLQQFSREFDVVCAALPRHAGGGVAAWNGMKIY